MTLILKLDLDMVKMYPHTKNEVSMSSGSKVIAWTDRNTDRQTDTQTHRHDQKHYLPAYAGGNNCVLPHQRVVHNFLLRFVLSKYSFLLNQYWTLLPPAKEVRGEVMFLQVSVCSQGGLWIMSLPVWLPGPLFLLGGLCTWSHVPSRRVCLQKGVCLQESLPPGAMGRLLPREPEKREVCNLLECFLAD